MTIRDYDELRTTRPVSTALQVSSTQAGEAITFQLWTWDDDGERYDLRHFLVVQDGGWRVTERRTTYWALTRSQLTDFAERAGLGEAVWHFPSQTGYYQPILLARTPAPRELFD